jgi:hypothetical protein
MSCCWTSPGLNPASTQWCVRRAPNMGRISHVVYISSTPRAYQDGNSQIPKGMQLHRESAG